MRSRRDCCPRLRVKIVRSGRGGRARAAGQGHAQRLRRQFATHAHGRERDNKKESGSGRGRRAARMQSKAERRWGKRTRATAHANTLMWQTSFGARAQPPWSEQAHSFGKCHARTQVGVPFAQVRNSWLLQRLSSSRPLHKGYAPYKLKQWLAGSGGERKTWTRERGARARLDD
eukprot:199979-Pleurochrysis_carterae.AAC.3